MAKIRLERVARQMQHVIGRVVTQELKDPRSGFVTIVGVKVASDLRQARVNFSVLGSDAQKRTVQRALESARGYIQTRVAQETGLKYTPVISFHLDVSAERDIELSRKIDETVKADRRNAVARAVRARVAGGSISDDIIAEVARAAASDEFIESVAEFLLELMDVETTIRPDVAKVAHDERRCLELIETALKKTWGDEVETEFLAIEPEIRNDAAFTRPGYATDADGAALPAERAHENRGNLVAVLRHGELPEPPAENTEGPLRPLRLAFNAHIDTVPPYIPPTRRGDLVCGRGACDAKGQVAMVVAAFRLLRHLRDRLGVRIRSDLCAQFVIDEETGGNGSLSLAAQDPFRFDGIVVCEATDLRVYTANRGALWYQAELVAPPGRVAELAAHFVLALEEEGRAIKAESDHPLFPDRPVQTNHGIIGPFGAAPSSVNDLVELEITSAELAPAEIYRTAERALKRYCSIYGDKTREADPETGRPKVAEHFFLEAKGEGRFLLRLHGRAGHMGSLAACDNAITKAAYVVRELSQLRTSGKAVHIALAGHRGDALTIEGAQGFVPTHSIRDVADRLAAAAERGAAEFCTEAGLEKDSVVARISFDRLHNDAFAREPDSELAVYAAESCRRAGLDVTARPTGWETSCDARLFADRFRDRDVIVFGPGQLRHAHAADESISLREIAAGARMLAFLALEAAGFYAPAKPGLNRTS